MKILSILPILSVYNKQLNAIKLIPRSIMSSTHICTQKLSSTLHPNSSKLPLKTTINSDELSYINSTTAIAIDEYLMQTPGFSIDQLMVLATPLSS